MFNRLNAQIAGLCSIVAGFLHITIVSIQHWTAFPPLESGFFMIAGLAQVVVGLMFFISPTPAIYKAGALFNGGTALLYIIVRFLPAPFSGEPEALETLGMGIVTLEFIAIVTALNWLYSHNRFAIGKTIPALSVSTFALILIGGFGFYGGARGMELVLPARTVSHDHHQGDHHEPVKIKADVINTEADVDAEEVHDEQNNDHHEPEHIEPDHHDNDHGHM